MAFIPVVLMGLAFGSFFSVLLARLFTNEDFLWSRSHCPACRHVLLWHDMLPLASFLWLRGRCRYCKGILSWWYPALELIVATALVMFFWQYGFVFSWHVVAALVLMLGFLLLAFFDAQYFILPDVIVFPLMVIGVAEIFFIGQPSWLNALITGFSMAGLFAILHIVSAGRRMGFGDVKLVFLIGVSLGYPLAVFVVLASIWLATIVGVVLLVLKKATLKTALPFGSFLAGVAALSIIFSRLLLALPIFS